jgi:hypothetical protein
VDGAVNEEEAEGKADLSVARRPRRGSLVERWSRVGGYRPHRGGPGESRHRHHGGCGSTGKRSTSAAGEAKKKEWAAKGVWGDRRRLRGGVRV